VLSNSPALLEESISGASGTRVVIDAGDGATDFVPALLPAVLFGDGAFFVARELTFFAAVCFKELFLAAFFPLFFAAPERDLKVVDDPFLDVLGFADFLAFFAPFLPPFLATIFILPLLYLEFRST